MLVRGDFLCEALEHLEATREDKDSLTLKLEEFWASEVCLLILSYHSVAHPDLVGSIQKNVSKKFNFFISVLL